MYSTSPQLKSLIGAVIFAFAGAVCAADYSAPPAKAAKVVETSGLEAARLAITKWDYEKAIELLKAEAAKDPSNADVQNLLGYSNRKLKRYDTALSYYQKALELQPKHRGANNYLGHLYLETGSLEKAQERLAVLDKACSFGCEEYSELKQAISAHKQQRLADN
jgi:Flp pilus assembly protein TadD